ncbi:MAG: DNA polymerase III subunit alpha [Cyclobacteriaceae bacterium]|nr:DNA polymerase III subunit alpha [Cyclobacteriaceae bacterium]
MYLIFDTETTGLPKNYNAPHTDVDNWPRMVQIAWQLHDSKGKLLAAHNYIIQPEGYTIPYNAEKVHGISTERALKEGIPLSEVLEKFSRNLENTELLIGHNINFDLNITGAEYVRCSMESRLWSIEVLDTMVASTDFCALPGGKGGKYKWPSLTDLHKKLFKETFDDAHDASYDVAATARCFFGLLTHKVVAPLDKTDPETIKYESPDLESANFAHKKKYTDTIFTGNGKAADIQSPFIHLHVHSQFSILQATPNIKNLCARAKDYNMPAVALTDLGNMMGAFKFNREGASSGIKTILGGEFFLSEDRTTLRFTKDNPDKRYNQVLLAKNKTGYQNLSKLTSLGYSEGLYGIYPRIDKELVASHAAGVMALTGNLYSEIPNLILNVGEHQAEEAFQWWLELFKDDFYVELNDHGLEEEKRVNQVLLQFAQRYGVKVVASNDVYYLDKSDAESHDILLCIKEGELKSTPVGRGRGFRYGFPNHEFYFKSQEEMKALFSGLPEAIHNISEILEKIDDFELKREVLLPRYNIPSGFETEDDYLRHITYEGAKKRYSDLTPAIVERLDFELETIKKTGYPGYFLIVQDFTNQARKMNVSVGPGRGSAAGSAVAYCIGITNVDPIEYDLLFERFLNPDRVSLPDIDIDFDDDGRGKIIDWVVNKYGKEQVAQIITYGTMAAKSSIRDCARVMELPLPEANAMAKLVPERPGVSLEKAMKEVKELEDIRKQDDLKGQVLRQAIKLEGSMRNTGVHACGVIITPDRLTNFVPMATSKDSDLLVTQFDNSVVENAGLLKMDFLGLKTLSVIKTAIEYIEKRHGIKIDPDTIPLDDTKTYELYQRGDTNGTFQFESAGMQKHLRSLKPDKFADLIAMNALFRPGPMEYIPNFIARKHGREPITYDLPEMEEYLAETYGITVYQEQVMLLSQKLANFSKGDADLLRKAMGKKIFALLEKLKPKFLEGCKSNGHDVEKAEKIWKDWEAFAAYAFNKSHSTCYSVVAFHTAYLKAHYPAEYMASVLTHNLSNITKVTFFLEECRHLGLKVLGPSVNHSGVAFEVDGDGQIRFGLGAIKGTGEAAVQAIIEERNQNGPFDNLFDFANRVNLRAVNKKTFEVLAMSGAFDDFGDCHRRQYLFTPDGDQNLIEKAIKYGNKMQNEAANQQQSLFGATSNVSIPQPKAPEIEPYAETEKLQLEKEVVGFFISGHPLDQFKFEMENLCRNKLSELKNVDQYLNQEMTFGGIVTEVAHKVSRNGKPFGILSLEDYDDQHTFYLFSDDYFKYKEFMETGWFLYVKGQVAEKPWGDKKPEFKIQWIQHLSELREKLTKRVILTLKPEDISDVLIDKLEQAAADNPGKCHLRLNLLAGEEKISLELFSKKFTIHPGDEFIKAISYLPEVECNIEV